jgi:hypothetical protein
MIKRFIRKRNGDVYLNDAIRYFKTIFLVPDQLQNPIITPAAPVAGQFGQSPPVIIEAPADALTQVSRFIGEHVTVDPLITQRLAVQVYDTVYRRNLMNRPILVDHVFGQRLVPPDVIVTDLLPFSTLTSLFFDPQQTLQLQFFNGSTAGPSSFRFLLEGREVEAPAWNKPEVKDWIEVQREKKKWLYPFWLTTDAPVVVPAGGSVDAFITVTKDIELALYKGMERFISTGAAGDTLETFTVELFDGQTERPLQNVPIARTSFAGNANFAYWQPTVWYLEPNSLIRARFKNLLTDQPNAIFPTWHGVANFVG